jgi:hypothetical protein
MATEPAFLSVTTGSVITANGRTYRVSHLLDTATLLAKDTDGHPNGDPGPRRTTHKRRVENTPWCHPAQPVQWHLSP